MSVRDEFSNQAFAVQVLVNDDAGVVGQVLVGRRPPGLYGSSDRSHLTGWETFVDGVHLHASYNISLDAAHKINEMIWEALTTSADSDDEAPTYDPDEFAERHLQYMGSGQGSQDEYQPFGSPSSSE